MKMINICHKRLNVCLFVILVGMTLPVKVFSSPLVHKKINKIEKFYKTGERGSFLTKEQLKISYIKFDADVDKPIIVISNGMSESYRKYTEFIYDLHLAGFSLYALDHRGMGYSEHENKNPMLVHLTDSKHYVSDFKMFMDKVVPKKRVKYLFAHSTGSFMSLGYIAQNPGVFKKIVLSAPLFGIKSSYPDFLIKSILWFRILIGKATEPVRGSGYFNPKNHTFEKNSVTHSAARYEYNKKMLIDNPELIMAGTTNMWVYQMSLALNDDWIKDLALNIKVPILLFQAGKDRFVRNDKQDEFCRLSSNCKKVKFENSRHELWREKEEIRSKFFLNVIEFLEAK